MMERQGQQRVSVQQSDIYRPTRKLPITHLLITATTSGGAQTLFTVNDNVIFEVKGLSVANITGTAATLTLHAVPDGGSIANGNAELVGYSVAANTAVDITDLVKGLYEGGTTLQCWSGTGSALVIRGHGEETR